MALTTRRDADVLARLLEGERPAGVTAELESLAELARSLPRPQVRPDPQFVARLRSDLVTAADARAATLPRQASVERTGRAAPPAVEPRTSEPRTSEPRTLVVRLPRRLVPAIAATLVGLAVLVGGLSSRALPGDRLYDVKLGIGQAQVRLAGSDLARGRALLGQVDHRLDEIDALVAAGDPRSAQVDVALTQATLDLAEAQRVLLSTGDGGVDPEALRALADASTQALGRLRALQPMLPTGSGPELHRLLDLLATGQRALTQQVTACGAPCAGLRDDLARIGVLGAGTSSGEIGGVGAVGGAAPSASPGASSVSVPGTAVTQVPGGGTVPVPDATGVPGASLPGVTASVPGVGVTVPGASLTTSSGGLPSVTLPPVEATVGSLTASVSVPALPLPSTTSSPSATSSSTSSSCVIALGDLCIG